VTPQQGKTAKRLGIAVLLQVLTIVWLLYAEFAAVAQGGNSTISELAWRAWADQPGAILGILLPLTAATAYLGGHFFWQSNRTMDRIRKGE